MVVYPRVSQKAIEFLNDEMGANSSGCRAKGANWSREDALYHQVIFSLLK
jgi:hypothetical protein